jgi:hypothetical protein
MTRRHKEKPKERYHVLTRSAVAALAFDTVTLNSTAKRLRGCRQSTGISKYRDFRKIVWCVFCALANLE